MNLIKFLIRLLNVRPPSTFRPNSTITRQRVKMCIKKQMRKGNGYTLLIPKNVIEPHLPVGQNYVTQRTFQTSLGPNDFRSISNSMPSIPKSIGVPINGDQEETAIKILIDEISSYLQPEHPT